jgi:hypothetical protein
MIVDEENFISGIHNYCDRWCERCTFTARCHVFAMEQQDTEDERDIHNEAFWRKIEGIFAQTKHMLFEIAEERGIDLNAVDVEEFRRQKQFQREKIRREDLYELAERYHKKAKAVLENKDDWIMFSALDEEAQAEMLEIIYWYQYFIAAKIQRGLSSIVDFDGTVDEELNDSQSDGNGSIKVALIALDRSIMAWTNLMAKENSTQIKPLLDLLETIQQRCREKFPNAQDFIRPGFDEVETVM